MTNVLVYVRPWNYHQFEDLANRTWNDAHVEFISEHRGQDSSGFISNFYKNYQETLSDDIRQVEGLTEGQVDDIIIRCRLLRALERPKALRLIKSALLSVESVFEKFSPDYVLSVTVDSYILHVLSIVCEQRKVEFIGIVPTFINGYFRITTTGEKAANRDVSKNEIIEVKKRLLEDQYRPAWLASSSKSINRRANKSWARNLIKPFWFFFYSLIKRDPLNAHYLTTRIISKRYWSIFPKKYSGITQLRQLESICISEKRQKVFLPLQMSPEATIDYWSADPSWVDYESKILRLIDCAPDHLVFLIKEHPNVLGFRSPGFYKILFSKPNVLALAPSLPSNDILGLSDLVLVCTGSVGFEALLRNKAVLSDSYPFYAPKGQFSSIDQFFNKGVSFSDWPEIMNADDSIRYVLSGCLKGTFINNGTWSKYNQQHLTYNMEVADSLKSYISEV